jgi:hypothetical protein
LYVVGFFSSWRHLIKNIVHCCFMYTDAWMD